MTSTAAVSLVSRGADGPPAAAPSGTTVLAQPVPAPVTDSGTVYLLSAAPLQPTADHNAVIDVYRWDGTGTQPVSVAGVAPLADVYGNARGFGVSGDGEFAVELRPSEDLLGPVRALVWHLADLQPVELPLVSSVGVDAAALSAGGRFVAFATQADALEPQPGNHASDVFRLDRSSGAVLQLSSGFAGGNANAPSVAPCLDESGTRVVFVSNATDLATTGANGSDQVYLWQQSGQTGGTLSLLSRRTDGTAVSRAWGGALSGNGDWVAFVSDDLWMAADVEGGGTAHVWIVSAGGTGLECVSIASGGRGANGDSATPAVNRDGRFVVFTSAATNLGDGAAGRATQVYLRDRLAGSTTLLSVSASGAPADADCQAPAVSPSGRYVTFVSAAANLVPDALPAALPQVYLVDRGPAFANLGPEVGSDHLISPRDTALTLPLHGSDPDGDTLAFVVTRVPLDAVVFDGPAAAPAMQVRAEALPHRVVDPEARVTLLPNPGFAGSVRVVYAASDGLAVSQPASITVTFGDLAQGVVQSLASPATGGPANGDAAPDGTAGRVGISASGERVVFTSLASNLVANDANAAADVFVWDRHADSLARVSVPPPGRPDTAGLGSDDAAISPDGGFIVFRSLAALSPEDQDPYADIYLRDLEAGTTTLVSRGVDAGPADGDSRAPDVSAAGAWVVFASTAANLLPAASGHLEQVYLWERATGRTTLVSRGADGLPANAACQDPRLAANAAAVVFHSAATNLDGPTAGWQHLFVYWRTAATLVRVSGAAGSRALDGNSLRPAISGSGRYLAFESDATLLVPADRNGCRDIFVCDLVAGLTERLSARANDSQTDQDCFAAAISANGRSVYFRSRAADLAGTPTGGVMSAFLVDRGRPAGQPGRLRLVSHGVDPAVSGNADTWNGALSATGQDVAFASDATNLVGPAAADRGRDVFVCTFADQLNRAPTALDSAVASRSDQPLALELIGLDPDQDDLSTWVAEGPQHGQLSPLDGSLSPMHPFPTARYTPQLGYTGVDRFRFSVGDGVATVAGWVTIAVGPAAGPPRLSLSRERVVLAPGVPRGTIPADLFLITDLDAPQAPTSAGLYLELLSEPRQGQLRDRGDARLHQGHRLLLADLPLTYEAHAAGQFAVERLALRAVGDGGTTGVVGLEIVVGGVLQDLQIETGWNLVALTMDPLDRRPDLFFASEPGPCVAGPVWSWDARRQALQSTDALLGGTGYWVYHPGEPLLLPGLVGRPLGGTQFELYPGWNLVGPVGLGRGRPVPGRQGFTSGYAWEWRAGERMYGQVEQMSAGRGCWVEALTPGTVSLDME